MRRHYAACTIKISSISSERQMEAATLFMQPEQKHQYSVICRLDAGSFP